MSTWNLPSHERCKAMVQAPKLGITVQCGKRGIHDGYCLRHKQNKPLMQSKTWQQARHEETKHHAYTFIHNASLQELKDLQAAINAALTRKVIRNT